MAKDSSNPLKKGFFSKKRRFLPKKYPFVNTLLKLVAEYSFSLQLKNQTYA
jgi:hypothetical protein